MSMKTITSTVVTIAVIAVGGAAIYRYLARRSGGAETPPSMTAQNTAAPRETTATPPQIRYPVPTESSQAAHPAADVARKRLPALDRSDQTLQEALKALFGASRFDRLFNAQNIVRRIVVTVDAATHHKQSSAEYWPLKAPDPGFLVTGDGDSLAIDESNFARYRPYVELLQGVDMKKLVHVYVHYYPLFQTAYEDLGSHEYFNDRLIAVIDHLLETPEMIGPVKVRLAGAIGNRYQYASDQIEGLSAAQKILVRMGHDNAKIVKSKLRQLRALLSRLETKEEQEE